MAPHRLHDSNKLYQHFVNSILNVAAVRCRLPNTFQEINEGFPKDALCLEIDGQAYNKEVIS